jgi:hypothetical protein
MKKIIAMAIIALAMTAPDSRAQTFPAMPQKIDAQTGEKTADKVTISANYTLSGISFSINDHDSGSILTWRDIYLHGAQINVGFNKTNIGVGFHISFHGYHTDDDATNKLNVIHIASTEAILLDLKYEILLEENKFTPVLGMDFNYLRLENYNAKPYSPKNDNHYWENLTGLANKSNVFKYGLYGGMQVKIIENKFYMNASGQIGFGLYLVLADWVLRQDFKHPVSFYNVSIGFRTGGDLEMGFRLGGLTIFTKALLMYEIGLGYNEFFLSNGDGPSIQPTTLDFFRPALNAGLKVSF